MNITYINNKLDKLDVHFNSKSLLESYKDIDKDVNIGTIDIETFLNKNMHIYITIYII